MTEEQYLCLGLKGLETKRSGLGIGTKGEDWDEN